MIDPNENLTYTSEATQPLSTSWLRIEIQTEFAPWSLALYVSRRWLDRPAQANLRGVAEKVWKQQQNPCAKQEGNAVAQLIFTASDLALICAPHHSYLRLWHEEFLLDTAQLARDLSGNLLVRVDYADFNRICVTILNGAVRIENLTRHPNIFDSISDQRKIWPAGANAFTDSLTAIQLSSRHIHIDLTDDKRSIKRLQYQRNLKHNQRLWLMVRCPYNSDVISPEQEIKRQYDAVTALLSSLEQQPVTIAPVDRSLARKDEENFSGNVFVITKFQTETTLVVEAHAGGNAVSVKDWVEPQTMIVLSAGRRREEIFEVTSAELGPDQKTVNLKINGNLRFNHQKCSSVQTDGTGSVQWYYQANLEVIIVNDNATLTTWMPLTFRRETSAPQSNEMSWVFDDFDPLNAETSSAIVSEDTMIVTWQPLQVDDESQVEFKIANLPELYCTGSDVIQFEAEYLWQPVQISQDHSLKPAVWLRHHFVQAEAHLPSSQEDRTFSQPVTKNWKDHNDVAWVIQGQPDDYHPDEQQRAILKILYHEPVKRVIPPDQPTLVNVLLLIPSPSVEVASPEMQFYTPPPLRGQQKQEEEEIRPRHLIASELPAMRQWKPAEFSSGALRFKNLIPLGKERLRLTHTENRFNLDATREAVQIYLPRAQAVFDFISLAQANLLAQARETEQSLSRDASHGLLTNVVRNFELLTCETPEGKQILCLRDPRLEAEKPPEAILGLHPWVSVRSDGKLVPMHRNLLLEKMEQGLSNQFLTSPVERVSRQFQTAQLIDCLRGAFSEASSELTGEAQALVNWFPGVKLVDDADAEIQPTLTWQNQVPSLPALVLDNGVGATSSLSLDSQFAQNFEWMHVDTTWKNPEETAPIVKLSSVHDPDVSHAYDGSVPWLYAPSTVRGIALNDALIALAVQQHVCVLDLQKGSLLKHLEPPGSQDVLDINTPSARQETGTYIVVRTNHDQLHAWHMQPEAVYRGHIDGRGTQSGGYAVNAEGLLWIGGADGSVRSFDIKTEVETEIIPAGGRSIVFLAFLEGQEQIILIASDHENAKVLTINLEGETQWERDLESPVSGAAYAQIDLPDKDPYDLLVCFHDTRLFYLALNREDPVIEPDPFAENIQQVQLRSGEKLSLKAEPVWSFWLGTLLQDDQLSVFYAEFDSTKWELDDFELQYSRTSVQEFQFTQFGTTCLGWLVSGDNELIEWDLSAGIETSRLELPEMTWLDNAGTKHEAAFLPQTGVLRNTPTSIATSEMRNKLCQLDGECVIAKLGTGSQYPTNIQLQTLELPVDEQHLVVVQDPRLPEVGYTLFSDLKAGKTGCSVMDYWPRLGGYPFRVTEMTRVQRDENGDLAQLVFQAVFPPPTDIGAADEANSEPAFVFDHVFKGNIVEVTIDGPFPVVDRDQISITSTELLKWSIPTKHQALFPARRFWADLKQITMQPVWENGKILFRPGTGRVEVLGTNLPLSDPLPDLIGFGNGNRFGVASELWSAEVQMPSAGPVSCSAACKTECSVVVASSAGDHSIILYDLIGQFESGQIELPTQFSVSALVCRYNASSSITAIAGTSEGQVLRATLGENGYEVVFALPAAVTEVAYSSRDPELVYATDGTMLIGQHQAFSAKTVYEIDSVSAFTSTDVGDVEYLWVGKEDGSLVIFQEGDSQAQYQRSVMHDSIQAVSAHSTAPGHSVVVGDAGGKISLVTYHPDQQDRSFSIDPVAAIDQAVVSLSVIELPTGSGVLVVGDRGDIFIGRFDSTVGRLAEKLGSIDAANVGLAVPLYVAGGGKLVTYRGDRWELFDSQPDIIIDVDLEYSSAGNSRVNVCSEIKLPVSSADAPQFKAAVKPMSRLEIEVQLDEVFKPALPALLENGVYSFLCIPAGIGWTEAQVLFALWPELSSQELEFGAMLLQESVVSAEMKINDLMTVSGTVRSLSLLYSTRLSGKADLLSWNRAQFASGVLSVEQEGAQIDLILADQLMALALNQNLTELTLSAFLHVKPGGDQVRFGGPVSLHVSLESELDDHLVFTARMENDAIYFPEPLFETMPDAPPFNYLVDTATVLPGQHYLGVPCSVFENAFNEVATGFVQLSLTENGFVLSMLPVATVPFDPCLEPGSRGRIPVQPDWVPRLSHRLKSGHLLNVRGAVLTSFQPESGFDFKSRLKEFIKTKINDRSVDMWNLQVVAYDSRSTFPGVLTYSADVMPGQIAEVSRANVQSENLLIVYAVQAQERELKAQEATEVQRRFVPLKSILNVTKELPATEPPVPHTYLDEATIQTRIEEEAAAGLCIHRILRPESQACFTWVSSPLRREISGTLSLEKLENGTPGHFDRRSLQPRMSQLWNSRATWDLLAVKPRGEQSAAQRDWLRSIAMICSGKVPYAEGSQAEDRLVHAIRLKENPLWNSFDSTPTWTSFPADFPEVEALFVPRFLQFWATSLKAGAMLSSSASLSITKNQSEIFPSRPVKGSRRDPQRFHTPPGAAIEFTAIPAMTPNVIVNDAYDLSVGWKETLCEQNLNELPLDSFSIKQDKFIEIEAGKIGLSLISRVGSAVYPVRTLYSELPVSTPDLILNPEQMCDLFVTSTVDLDGVFVSDLGTHFKLKVKLTCEPANPDPTVITVPFCEYFTKFEISGGFYVWKRKVEKSNPANLEDLNVVSVGFVLVAEANPEGALLLQEVAVRPVHESPLTAKIALLATREQDDSRSFERVALFGDAAGTQTEVNLVSDTNTGLVSLAFSRNDQDTVTMFPSAESSEDPWKIYLIKILKNGAILLASKKI